MGIHGIFKQIGVGTRISLAKFSRDHFITYNRPLRLAIDISIWLFQIQSGKGGSNPALRTFYYRLLRLLNLNIHPLFVFDGPNKPLFKRNKKVGGPGVRVASVPEFLAKQLLKQFGFPWHVAPGEAEAECALLQRRSIVDAVLSEDVDTLMFGSGVTIRNWTPEGSTKTPTHVNLYRAEQTKAESGLDRQGMILVALMSGGDYLPDGIPGCGPKLACDAARAGFGDELCTLNPRDPSAINSWKERLNHEIQTNEGKHFSRKMPSFKMPVDFPNLEVLGYYTHPCVSSEEKLNRLKEDLRWDQEIDYAALRTFTADAFDWRCLGGAQKFIRNLAPAILTRELRLRAPDGHNLNEDAQTNFEKVLVAAVHGKRTHYTTDGELEYRVSFTPVDMVPIDLSIEEEDDQYQPAGGDDEEHADCPLTESADLDEACPGSPTKKARQFKPYDPTQPEKLWIMKDFLQIGCPLLIEKYEGNLRVGKNTKSSTTSKPTKSKTSNPTMPSNTLMRYVRVVKSVEPDRQSKSCDADSNHVDIEIVRLTQSPEKPRRTRHIELNSEVATRNNNPPTEETVFALNMTQGSQVTSTCVPLPRTSLEQRPRATFRLPSLDPVTQPSTQHFSHQFQTTRPYSSSIQQPATRTSGNGAALHRTPRKKRPSPDLESPNNNQRTITSFYTPSRSKPTRNNEVISLLSSSPPRASTPTPSRGQHDLLRRSVVTELGSRSRTPDGPVDCFTEGLPDTVTKRRSKKPLKRHKTAPVTGDDNMIALEDESPRDSSSHDLAVQPFHSSPAVDALDLTMSSPMRKILQPEETTRQSTTTNSSCITNLTSASGHASSSTNDSMSNQENLSNSTGAPNDSVTDLSDLATTLQPKITSQKSTSRKRIHLRESLNGAWGQQIVDERNVSDTLKNPRSANWRMSMVEMVDMTNDF